MEQNLKKIFKIGLIQSKPEFSSSIWFFILKKEARIFRIKKWSYASLGILSLSGFIFAIKDLMNQFIQSGFYEYMSLAFSDSGYISSHWKDFVLSLADSLPTTSLILTLCLLFVFFISIRKVVIQSGKQLSVA